MNKASKIILDKRRACHSNDRQAARHCLGGIVLAGLTLLGVGSAIAVYHVPGGHKPFSATGLLPDSPVWALAEVANDAGMKPNEVVNKQAKNTSSTAVDRRPGFQAFSKPVLSDARFAKIQLQVLSVFESCHVLPQLISDTQLSRLKAMFMAHPGREVTPSLTAKSLAGHLSDN